jgi:hypothetical protein
MHNIKKIGEKRLIMQEKNHTKIKTCKIPTSRLAWTQRKKKD